MQAFATKTAATAFVGGLSAPGKMPCKSWSIPISRCITGSKLAKVAGSTCSECYAGKGNYLKYAGNIIPAQERRLSAWESDRAAWRQAMVLLLSGEEYFRVFDAGDLQSVDMLEDWCAIARACKTTRFWLPTREYGIVAAFLANGGKVPKNMVVRLSAMHIDQKSKLPASIAGFKQPNIRTSEVHSTDDTLNPAAAPCGAYTRQGTCGPCRMCWDAKVKTVSYPQH